MNQVIKERRKSERRHGDNRRFIGNLVVGRSFGGCRSGERRLENRRAK